MQIADITAGRGRTALLVILGSLTAFTAMSTDMYLPAFPHVASDLGVDVSSIQLTLSASFLGVGAGQLIYGPLSDRFGRKPPLIAGIALYILASLGCAIAPTLAALIGLRLLQALGGCAAVVIARAIVRDLFHGAEMARTMSAMAMVFAFAPALAPSLGSLLLAVASWHWVFVSLAVFGAISLAAVFTLPETLEHERRTDHGVADAMRAYGAIARDREYRVATGISVMGTVTLTSFISSSPVIFMDTFGVSSAVFGVLFGVNSLGMVVGGRINIRMLHRHAVERVLRSYVLAQALAGAVLLALVVAGVPWPILLLPLMVATGANSSIFANAVSISLRAFRHNAASAAALGGTLQMCMGAAFSALLAALPFPATLKMATCMVLASTVGLVLASRALPAAMAVTQLVAVSQEVAVEAAAEAEAEAQADTAP